MNKKLITIELKKETIDRQERGVCEVDIACQYDRSTSAIYNILKEKNNIKAVTTTKVVSGLSKWCTSVHEGMEKLLLLWINKGRFAVDTMTETIIWKKEKTSSLWVSLEENAWNIDEGDINRCILRLVVDGLIIWTNMENVFSEKRPSSQGPPRPWQRSYSFS